MLPNALLSRIFRVRDWTFRDTVQVLSHQKVSNGAGGWGGGWVVTSTSPGRFRRSTVRPAQMALQGDVVQPVYRFQILLPLTATVSIDNRLRVNGRDFVVRGHDTGRTGALMIIVDCDPFAEGL